jgi:hypothetical protein
MVFSFATVKHSSGCRLPVHYKYDLSSFPTLTPIFKKGHRYEIKTIHHRICCSGIPYHARSCESGRGGEEVRLSVPGCLASTIYFSALTH